MSGSDELRAAALEGRKRKVGGRLWEPVVVRLIDERGDHRDELSVVSVQPGDL